MEMIEIKSGKWSEPRGGRALFYLPAMLAQVTRLKRSGGKKREHRDKRLVHTNAHTQTHGQKHTHKQISASAVHSSFFFKLILEQLLAKAKKTN